ncbi:Ala-tRNA(Pro) hydrolase [Shimia gijangensis]|uniref:Alanine--tRNA ligase n=1 Tax=Shimia gijangensis TaxID=1470563 RepID=A0A1M6QVV7_9RHOB|nr:alanyl-tRNA editing protein [Shimia gijangensis]SHK24371.1 Ala-tRNA(Pro) hydrolase [Shimia gijangensis]
MSELLFRDDAYLRQATGTVVGHTPEGGIILDRCLFYPTGGGQPGDSGDISWNSYKMPIATTVKAEGNDIALVQAEPAALPPVGTKVTQTLDWERRHRLMRVHTALHLLSVIIPLPVTGGSISPDKGRLDFDMPEALENKEALTDSLNRLIERDLVITEGWITSGELEANPSLVKTMSVKPPMGEGQVRLIRIGEGGDQVDLQPCGGTHVARTGEIGRVRIGKVEKKGRQNRRVYLHLDI